MSYNSLKLMVTDEVERVQNIPGIQHQEIGRLRDEFNDGCYLSIRTIQCVTLHYG